MSEATVHIKPGHTRRIFGGHPWIFSNELEHPFPDVAPGSIVNVQSAHHGSHGVGLFNPNSLIAVRLLHHHAEVDEDFFVKRIQNALDYRARLYPHEKSYRLVFGESDFLPGLIIDRYENYFSVQLLSLGMELRKAMIYAALQRIFSDCTGIIAKNNSALRKLEGLPEEEEIVFGTFPDYVQITEEDLQLMVPVAGGQKTGYYFDQRKNRLEVARIASGKTVLDCFSNIGGFALHCLKQGAADATSVDNSQGALDAANSSAQANGVELRTVRSDVFTFLESAVEQGKLWDIVIIDPPAFAKNKKHIATARKGYQRINKLAMQLVKPGGFLATASCSHHISEELFLTIVTTEAIRARRQLRLVYRGGQSPDHPILMSMPETNYLKFFLFNVT